MIAEAAARRTQAAAAFNALQAGVVGEIERAVAGYRAAVQKRGDTDALRTNLLKQEKTAQAMLADGQREIHDQPDQQRRQDRGQHDPAQDRKVAGADDAPRFQDLHLFHPQVTHADVRRDRPRFFEFIMRMNAGPVHDVERAGEFVLVNRGRPVEPEQELDVEPRIAVGDDFGLTEGGIGLGGLVKWQALATGLAFPFFPTRAEPLSFAGRVFRRGPARVFKAGRSA